MTEISSLEVIVRLLVAGALCALVGFEREYRHKPAGIRTNALVGIGTALFTILSIELARGTTAADPTRIASTVLTGIGFIGAGTIIQSRGIVKGLTTAATIWVVSAIGMAAGFGMYDMALAAAVIALLVLTILRNIKEEDEHEHDSRVQR